MTVRRKATVTALLPDGRAELLVSRKSACSGDCHTCGGCGAVEQTLCLTAQNPVGARPGDIVWLESDSRTVLTSAALLYLLPLLLFFAGYLAAMSLGSWAAAVGAGGFAIGLLPAFWYNRRLKMHPPDYTIVGFVK